MPVPLAEALCLTLALALFLAVPALAESSSHEHPQPSPGHSAGHAAGSHSSADTDGGTQRQVGEQTAERSTEQAAEQTSVFLVRHAEKASGTDPELTEIGRQRACSLIHILGQVGIDNVFSTPLRRTQQTAAPLAQSLGLDVLTTPLSSDHATEVARRMRDEHAGQTVVVIGHSNTLPAIAEALGAGPAPGIDESEYDDLWLVTWAGNGDAKLLRLRYRPLAVPCPQGSEAEGAGE